MAAPARGLARAGARPSSAYRFVCICEDEAFSVHSTASSKFISQVISSQSYPQLLITLVQVFSLLTMLLFRMIENLEKLERRHQDFPTLARAVVLDIVFMSWVILQPRQHHLHPRDHGGQQTLGPRIAEHPAEVKSPAIYETCLSKVSRTNMFWVSLASMSRVTQAAPVPHAA